MKKQDIPEYLAAVATVQTSLIGPVPIGIHTDEATTTGDREGTGVAAADVSRKQLELLE
jgi:hypothetical protein